MIRNILSEDHVRHAGIKNMKHLDTARTAELNSRFLTSDYGTKLIGLLHNATARFIFSLINSEHPEEYFLPVQALTEQHLKEAVPW